MDRSALTWHGATIEIELPEKASPSPETPVLMEIWEADLRM